MWLSRALAWIVCVSLALPSAIPAEQVAPPQPLPKTVAVAAFKNGLAFVVRQGPVQLQSGTGRITPIPNATLGTLWLAPGEANTTLDEVVAYRYSVAAERQMQSLAEVLQANVGKTVTVTYSMNMKDYTGEIVGVRESKPAPDEMNSEGVSQALANIAKPQYLLLRVDKKLLALPIGSIANAALPDDTVFHEKIEQPRSALRFKVKGANDKTELTMGYLEHGLGWTPSYMISLTDDKTAQITMQAVMIDDAEDLNNADVFFVVGVPNFAYSETPSPMSLQQNLLSFMKDAEKRDDGNYRRYSNAIAGQMIAGEFNEFDKKTEPSFSQTVSELSGAPEEDLFLYSRSGVTLARGERATYNVFSSSVSYEHIYDWEVVDPQRVDGFGNVVQYNPNSPDSTAQNSIWHSIRLKNTTKFPWTSAPTMVISGLKPVSQDTLPYTPKAASSKLKITVATDIRSSHEEREIARQQNVQRRHGYEFDLVTVEGTLKLKNYKSKEVRIEVGKTLRGEVEMQSDEGKAVKLGEAIQMDNPLSRLTWGVPLKAGEEKVVTYRYKIFVRG
ncbi:MAG TPA: hypothetical protein VN025_02055 [Candidatus Dormibacteraeota bacterium]|jgi:hypothetical protein|nr:hypothetical protein [Candidatus Dormibacteraeota bacterium]